MGELFGTDGIRGVAGEPPLDQDTIYRIGYCLTRYLQGEHRHPRVLIARDTRISGPWIEGLLRTAIHDAGGTTESCGVLSTPAVSFLARQTDAHSGVMISASHNHYLDNGIKIFSTDGIKFSEETESKLEKEILAATSAPAASVPMDSSPKQPDLRSGGKYSSLYTKHLIGCLPPGFTFEGMRLVVDCANGALSHIAPGFFRELGAEIHAIHCEPTGRNINLQAGALHTEKLQQEVRAREAMMGIAFDGDADRAMFVDSQGVVRDGDDVLYLLACHYVTGNAPRTVVGTVMANLGLQVALEERGFRLVRTAVGDRYVLEEMLRSGAVVGGEQSGHIIMTKLARTGDGLLTALKVMEILKNADRDLAGLCSFIKRFPQILLNIPVREKVPLAKIPGLSDAEAACNQILGPRSRILLRYSGTEKLARVMVEGEDDVKVKEAARTLASIFENHLAP